MKKPAAVITALALIMSGITGTSTNAQAQTQAWPSKPVTLLVPFPPGGSTDMIARTLGPKLQEKLGGTFIVSNVSGAGGTVGAAAAKRAAPDGYTIFVSSLGPFVIGPHLIKGVAYDPLKDFDYITHRSTSRRRASDGGSRQRIHGNSLRSSCRATTCVSYGNGISAACRKSICIGISAAAT